MSKNIDDGFRKLVLLVSRYVLVMIIVALVVGVVYREYSKAMLNGMPLEETILASYYLSLSHGHILIACVALPTVLLVVTYLVAKTGLGTPNYRSLRRAFTIYIIGVTGAVALLVYKGLGTIYYYAQNPSAGLTAADNMLFLGSHALRETLYGIIHLLLGIGLAWYTITLLKTIKTPKNN